MSVAPLVLLLVVWLALQAVVVGWLVYALGKARRAAVSLAGQIESLRAELESTQQEPPPSPSKDARVPFVKHEGGTRVVSPSMVRRSLERKFAEKAAAQRGTS